MKDRIAAEKKAMGETSKPGKLTISYDGHALLIDDVHPNTPSDEQVDLLRGDESYIFWPKGNAEPGHFPGTVSYGLNELPIIGPSLPFLPVIRDGKVLTTIAFDKQLVYRDGQASTGKDGILRHVRFGNRKDSDTFELSAHREFLDRWVAGSVDWKVPFLHREIRYKLVEVRSSALSAEAFDPAHYGYSQGPGGRS